MKKYRHFDIINSASEESEKCVCVVQMCAKIDDMVHIQCIATAVRPSLYKTSSKFNKVSLCMIDI